MKIETLLSITLYILTLNTVLLIGVLIVLLTRPSTPTWPTPSPERMEAANAEFLEDAKRRDEIHKKMMGNIDRNTNRMYDQILKANR